VELQHAQFATLVFCAFDGDEEVMQMWLEFSTVLVTTVKCSVQEEEREKFPALF
jgi:Zn ribbon nucleic-acid-binding protein